VRKTAEFLGKELNDEEVARLCDHLSFKSMKNNPSVNFEAVIEINRTFELVPPDGEFMRQGIKSNQSKSKSKSKSNLII